MVIRLVHEQTQQTAEHRRCDSPQASRHSHREHEPNDQCEPLPEGNREPSEAGKPAWYVLLEKRRIHLVIKTGYALEGLFRKQPDHPIRPLNMFE